MILPRKRQDGSTAYGVRISRDGEREWVGTFDTRKQARYEEAQALSRKPDRKEEVTCDQFVDFWLEGYEQRTKHSTHLKAVIALRTFKTKFEGRTFASLDPIEAETWARENQWRLGPVITMVNSAVRKQLLERNPFSGLAPQSDGRRYNQPLTEKEVHSLADAAREAHGNWGATYRALLLFAAYTGLRGSELFALEWRDIDFEHNRLYVRRRFYQGNIDTPKSGKPERVLLPPARDALLSVPRTGELIFTGKSGQRLSHERLYVYLQKVEGKFGKRVTLHELRHFAGHHLYVTLGLPSRIVAVQLGHKNPRMVEELYGHGEVGALEEIEAAYGRKPMPVRNLREAK